MSIKHTDTNITITDRQKRLEIRNWKKYILEEVRGMDDMDLLSTLARIIYKYNSPMLPSSAYFWRVEKDGIITQLN